MTPSLPSAAEEFLPERLHLRVEPILRFHRYRDASQVAPAIREVAEEMVRVAAKLVEPRVVFLRRRVVGVTDGAIRLEGGAEFHGGCLGAHLGQAREAICFLATIGPALDDRVSALAEGGDLLEALFLDTVGWLAVEEVLRVFRGHLGLRLRGERLRLGPRLGPGYLDWPLGEQRSFFGLFGGVPLPVTVSQECVMSPRKSLSGLFGLLPRG